MQRDSEPVARIRGNCRVGLSELAFNGYEHYGATSGVGCVVTSIAFDKAGALSQTGLSDARSSFAGCYPGLK